MKSHSVDRLFNVVVIVALVGTVWRFVAAREPGVPPQPAVPIPSIALGSEVVVPGLELGVGRRLLMLLDADCPGCEQSAPALSDLSERAGALGIETVVVAADPTEIMEAWLKKHGLRANYVLRVKAPSDLGFIVTPTVLLLSERARVTDIVEKTLSVAERDALRSSLEATVGGGLAIMFPRPRLVDPRSFDASRLGQVSQVLDIREREEFAERHRPDSLNIPIAEIKARSRAEMQVARPVALSCEYADLRLCQVAGSLLARLGFEQILIIRSSHDADVPLGGNK